MKITKEDIGKTFRTRGGWDAQVVWVFNDTRDDQVVVIHKPHTGLLGELVSEEARYAGEDGTARWTYSVEKSRYDLLPPVETKRVRVMLADQREFLPETTMCDVDLLDGKIVAVRLVEEKP